MLVTVRSTPLLNRSEEWPAKTRVEWN